MYEPKKKKICAVFCGNRRSHLLWNQRATNLEPLEFGEIKKFSRQAEQAGNSNNKYTVREKIKTRLYSLML